MAIHQIRSSGVSQVPLGGTARASITTKESGELEEVNTVQAILKNSGGTTISDVTWSGSDINTTASDGGAIRLNADPAGDGTYTWEYEVPNDGTYTPPAAGLQFSIQFVVDDEDGGADTGAISFFVTPASISVSIDTRTIAAVVKRRAHLIHDILIQGESRGSDDLTLDLGSGIIHEIEAAYKNGVAIAGAGTDYTHNAFGSRVLLASAAVDGDEFVFKALTRMSTEQVTDYIEESYDIFAAKLKALYDYDDFITSPEFEALVALRTIGLIKQDLAKGALDNPDYRLGVDNVKEAHAIISAIQRGEAGLNDASGDLIAPLAGAMVGTNPHADGPVRARIDMVDRAQTWKAIAQEFYPEIVPTSYTSPRNL